MPVPNTHPSILWLISCHFCNEKSAFSNLEDLQLNPYIRLTTSDLHLLDLLDLSRQK